MSWQNAETGNLRRRITELEVALRVALETATHERAAAHLARESAARAWRVSLVARR